MARRLNRSTYTTPRLSALAVALWLLAATAFVGCSRQAPLADIGSSGATVWVHVTTQDGEEVTGRLVSADARAVVVALEYDVTGEVRPRDRAGERALYSGTERVPGQLVRIGTRDGVRFAVVHRRFRAVDVVYATFHEGGGERSLASILSFVVGPALGGALALVF